MKRGPNTYVSIAGPGAGALRATRSRLQLCSLSRPRPTQQQVFPQMTVGSVGSAQHDSKGKSRSE